MAASQTRIDRVPLGSRHIDSDKSDNVHFFINLTLEGNFHMILTIQRVDFEFAALRLERVHSGAAGPIDPDQGCPP